MLCAVLLLGLVLIAVLILEPWWRQVRRPQRRIGAVLGATAYLSAVAGLGLSAADSQKMLAHLIMPPGLIWLGLIALVAALVRRRQRGPSLLAGAVLLLFSVSGNILLGTLGLISLQSELPLVDWTQGEPFDAVLVLGGGTKPQPAPARFGLAGPGDRVLLGARLYRRDRVRTLICSGRGVPGLSDEDLTEATSLIWQELGVDPAHIERLRTPFNTKQELQALQKLIAERGWRRVGLLSSGYHLPRAMAQAGRLGLELVPLRADEFIGPDRFTALSLVPQRGGFARTQAVVWEHLGRRLGR